MRINSDSAWMPVIYAELLPRYGYDQNATVTDLGNGLINDTFLVRQASRTMVLQRLNCHVFPNPQRVVENALCIAEHLGQQQAAGHYKLSFIAPYASLNGGFCVDLQEQGFWRGMSFIGNSTSYDVPTSTQQITDAAGAYGHFNAALCSLDSNLLSEVISNFHHLPARLTQLEQAKIHADKVRLNQGQAWYDFALAQTDLLDEFSAITPQLPQRICHYDTKLNNMLFDQTTNKPLAIIDLDTCMPGYLMYDFGDMVRALCASSKEDMRKFDDIYIKPDAFAAVVEGYVGSLSQVIKPIEKQSLWLGVKLVTLELAVRFLTDYFNGDQYFHTQYPQQNLERARNQFTLYQSLLAQQNVLQSLL